MNVTATGIAVALAVLVAFGLLVFGPGMFAPTTQSNQDILLPNTMTGPENQSAPIPAELPNELTVTDEVVGTGDEATPGSMVAVRYTGMLPDGSVFDTTAARNDEPFTFVLGQGSVIQGWDQGLVGMKEGGKRRLIIPPSMGYGAQGVGPIPPNATLIFDVELLSVN